MNNALHFKAKAQNAKQGGIVKMKKLFTKWLSALLIAALLLPCVAVAEGEISGEKLTFDSEPSLFDTTEDSEASDGEIIPGDESQDEDTADDGEIFEADETEAVEPESEALILEDTIDDPDATDENAVSDDTAVADETTASDETAADETEQPSDEDADVPEVEIAANSVDEFVSEGDFDELPTEDSDDEELFFVDEGEMESVSSEAMYADGEGGGTPGGLQGPAKADGAYTVNYSSSGEGFNAAVGYDGWLYEKADEGQVLVLYVQSSSFGFSIKDANGNSVESAYDNSFGGYKFTMPASDVYIEITVNSGTQGGGQQGGGSGTPGGLQGPPLTGTYAINFAFYGDGSGISYAVGKETQQVVSADAGWELALYIGGSYSNVSITTVNGDPVSFVNEGGRITFTMPASAINIGITPIGGSSGPVDPIEPSYPEGDYSITIGESEHGSVSVGTDGRYVTTASEGWWMYIESAPETGYRLGSVTVMCNGQIINEDGDTNFTMPAGDVTVNATFVTIEGGEYPIQFAECQNGSVSASVYGTNVTSANAGEPVDIEIRPADGYHIKSVSATFNGGELPVKGTETIWGENGAEGAKYTYTMPQGALSVSATMTQGDHSIAFGSIPEGCSLFANINGTRVSKADQGEKVALTVWGDDENRCNSLSVKCGNEDVPLQYDDYYEEYFFEMPNGDVAVSATFIGVDQGNLITINNEHTHTNGVMISGFFSEAEAYRALEGETVTINFDDPEKGYSVSGVTVTCNDASVPVSGETSGKAGTFSFTMPNGDVVITITATTGDVPVPVVKYNLTTEKTGNGTVSAPASAAENDQVEFTVIPDEGWIVDSVTVKHNGEEVGCTEGQDGKYTFTMPGGPVTVSATFVSSDTPVTSYNITYKDEITNGSVAAKVNGAVVTSAAKGDIVTLVVTPDEGYETNSLHVYRNGEEVSLTNNTFSMPSTAVTIEATFRPIDYAITVSSAANGTVIAKQNGAQVQTAHYLDTADLDVTPAEGYELESLTVTDSTGNSVPVSDNSFTMPAGNVTIVVTFRPIDYAITVSAAINGTVIAKQNGAQVQTAHYLDTVYLNVTPAEGYELDTLTVTGPEGAVSVSEDGTFSMPAGDVTVSATFRPLTPTGAVPIDEGHFPDAALRAYVSEHFDSDKDNSLSAEEIENAQSIDLQGESIVTGQDEWGNEQWGIQPKVATLAGIEYFTNLRYLYVSHNELTDTEIARVSGLTSLVYLDCSDNNLTAVDVSALTNLGNLHVANNQISKLDVSNNKELSSLNCYYNNLSALDVHHNTKLSQLNCAYNNITELNVNSLVGLKELWSDGNKLTGLDVSHNPNLISLHVSDNPITELDISNCPNLVAILDDKYLRNDWGNSVRYEKQDENGWIVLDFDLKTRVIAGDKVIEPSAIVIDSSLFPDPALRQYVIDCIDGYNGAKDGYLSKGEISNVNYIQLVHYDLDENGYGYNFSYDTGLGVSNLQGLEIFTNLTYLNVANNTLTAIDVSAFSSLRSLNIHNNNIASLDITPCPIIAAIVNDDNRSSNTMYPSMKRVITYSHYDDNGYYVSVSYDSETKLILNGEEVKAAEIALNVENFPDEAFRAELSDRYDSDKNDVLSESEVDGMHNMLSIFDNSEIESLEGIELFKGLSNLYLGGLTNLKSLDLSKNTRLSYISLNRVRGFSELDVSMFTQLWNLTVTNCGIERLTLGELPNLNYVRCEGNKIKTLDISQCSQTLIDSVKQDNYKLYDDDTVVHYEVAWQNQDGPSPVGPYAQIYLSCDADVQITGGNPVAPIAVPAGIAIDKDRFPDDAFRQYVLDNIDNGDEELSTYEISTVYSLELNKGERNSQTGHWETKPLGVKSLAGIEVFTELESLDSSDNPLARVDLSKNTKLKWLYLQDNPIEELDISGCTELESLDCNGTKLKTLDLRNNKKLVSLYCMYNEEMTSLNISGLAELERAYVSYNALTGLDASNLPKLFKLDCRGNGMTMLDVSNDNALVSLLCDGNPIAEVDFTSCPDYLALLKGSIVVTNDGVTVYEDYNVGTGDDSDSTSTHLTCNDTMAIIGLTAATRFNITVDMPENSHGAVSVVEKAPEGATVRVTVDPEAYYECTGVTASSGNANLTVNRVDEKTFTFAMPAGNVTVSATFGLIAFDIVSMTDPSNVTVTATPVAATIGETVELTLTPGVNRVVTGVKVMFGDEEVAVTATDGKYTFTMPGGDVEVTALFKRVPQVTAPEAIALVYNGTDQKLVSAARTDGGTLKYSLDGETWSAELPTGRNAGSYTVRYKVEGNDDYTDVAPTEVVATIAKKALTITACAKTKTIGAVDPRLEYDCTGLVADDKVTGELDRVSGEAVGSYDITIGTLSAGDNYEVIFNGAKLEIISKKITVIAKAKTKTYGEADPALDYTVVGLTDEEANPLTGSLNREQGDDVGQYAITQGSLAAQNGYDLNFVSAKLTINPKPLTVTADAKSKIYGAVDPELTYTSTGLVGDDVLTGALTRETGEDVGTYAITQGNLNVGDNYDLTFVGADLTINKKALTVTADAKTKIYGDADPELTYKAEGLMAVDELTGALERVPGVNAGTYAINQGTLKASDNYDLTFVGADLTINKKALTVTADAKTKIYGESDPTLTYTVTGLVGSDRLTGQLTRAEGDDAKTYAINQGTLSAGDNYTLNFTPANLTIGKKALTVTADAKAKKYGEDDPELTYTVTGLVGNDTLTGALSRETGDEVGTYAINQGNLSAGDNYEMTFVGAEFTIGTKVVTVTAEAKSKTYGDADPELTYNVEGLEAGDELTGALSREPGDSVGTYAIGVGTLSAGDSYVLNFKGANLTIGKRALTVTADAVSKIYGEADPDLSYKAEGLVTGDQLTGALNRAAGENVGEYDIGIGTLDAGNNYTVNFVPAKLTIGKKTLTVTPDAVSKTYGDAEEPELTYTVDGLMEGDALTGALAREPGVNVRTYAITKGTLAAGQNYTLEVKDDVLFTIEPKPLTITADAQTKTYGEADPELTYTADGLVEGDVLPEFLTREAGTNAGTYAITRDAIDEAEFIGNYAVTFNGANLTIEKKPLTIKADSSNRKTYGNNDPETLSFTTDGLITGDAITEKLGRVAGETVGSYAYDTSAIESEIGDNYDISVEGRFIIAPKPVDVTWDNTPLVYNGYAQKPTATVTEGALVGNDICQVIVETRNGDETIETVDAGEYRNTAVAVSLTNPNYTLEGAENSKLASFTIRKAEGRTRDYPKNVSVDFNGVTDGKLDLSAYLTDAKYVKSIEKIGDLITEATIPDLNTMVLNFDTTNTVGREITSGKIKIYIEGKNYTYGDEDNAPALIVTFKTSDLFTLRFNTDGGTQEKNKRLHAGETISDYLPEAPTKDGYTFDRWYSDPAKTVEVVVGENGTRMGAADAMLYAGWIPNVYSIKLSGGVNNLPENVRSDMTYTVADAAFNLPVLPDVKSTPEYTFLGWLPENAAEGDLPQIDVTIDPADHPADANEVITYVAKWRVGALAGTVTFDNTAEGSNLKGIQGMETEASTDDGKRTTPLAMALKEVAAQQSEENAETKVTMSMGIAVADESGEQAQKIIENIPDTQEGIERKSDFIDISILKSTQTIDEYGQPQGNAEEQAVTETSRVMEIPLQYDLTGLYNFTIMRAHEQEDGTTKVDTFTKLKSKPRNPVDGTFYVSGQGSNAVVHTYTDRFCTFCGTGTTSGEHEVTFLMEAGSDKVYETDQKSVENGGTVTVPEDPAKPTENGIAYRFDGWREEAKSVAYDFSAPVYGDVTLVGMWTAMREAQVSVKAEYSATYDGEEHLLDAPVIDEESKDDVDVYFSLNKLTKDNAEVDGVSYGGIKVTEVGTTTIYWFAVGDNVKPSVESGTIVYTLSKKQTAPSNPDNTSNVSAPSISAPVSAPAPASETEPMPTIISNKKNVKATVEVGKVYQIDLVDQSLVGKKYKSSKKKIATVSATGLVTPKKAGKAKITFKVGKKKRTITLKVVDPTVPKGIQLNATSLTVKKGETQTLTYTLLPEGIAKSAVTWKTSNKKVATVKNGVVTFKKKGKVTITAITKSGKKKAKVKFTVTD